jgi:mono/diheme cytochrome c family protein
MARVTVDRIYRSIKEGKPGTAMAAWKEVFSELEIGDLIDYIHSLLPAKGPALSPEQLSLEIGRRLYKQSCVVCHGEDGRADTEAAKVLDPPPRRFTDPIEMARVDDGRMYLAIKRGVHGTGMAGWEHVLGPAEIIDVMRYLRTLVEPLPAGMTQADLDLAVGRQIYEKRCAACHGDKGNGKSRLGRNLVPPPRDFTDAQRMATLSDKDLARAITQGRPGTAMAPWRGLLNAEDVRRVILFIRRTFQRAR